MIYLLNTSSAINVKTSLVQWSKYRHDIGGFVCMNILDKLTLRQFSTATYTLFQVPENYNATTTVFNNYTFVKSAFQVAQNWMEKDIQSEKLKYFFLDEVGQLELDNLGHDPLIRQIIQIDNENQIFILLVREALLRAVQKKYNFQNKKVIHLKQVTG